MLPGRASNKIHLRQISSPSPLGGLVFRASFTCGAPVGAAAKELVQEVSGSHPPKGIADGRSNTGVSHRGWFRLVFINFQTMRSSKIMEFGISISDYQFFFGLSILLRPPTSAHVESSIEYS